MAALILAGLAVAQPVSAQGLPAVTLALTPATIDESGANNKATVTATLDRASITETTVTVSASPGAGTDFRLSANTMLVIAAGAMTASATSTPVTITAVDDDTDSPHKSVSVSGTARNSQGVVGPGDVILTIRDDDPAPTVTLVVANASISENGGVATVSATLDHASSAATTVTVSASPGAGTDFRLSANTILTIAAGAVTTSATSTPVTITAVDDDVSAPDKVVRVSGAARNTQGVTAPDDVTLIIEDDDFQRLVPQPGRNTYQVNGQSVVIMVTPDAPRDVAIEVPSDLERSVTLTLGPPAADVPIGSARFQLGNEASRRTVVDVTVSGAVPPGGLGVCLPVTPGLRGEVSEETNGGGLVLLHYDGSAWNEVANSRYDGIGMQVCASGITTFSPFAVGYADRRPVFDRNTVAYRFLVDAPVRRELPGATRGDGSPAYMLVPGLPSGLRYTAPGSGETHGGTLSGTPESVTPPLTYTLTASDVDGDEATLSFTIEVTEDDSRDRLRAVSEAILPEFSRAMSAGMAEAVAERMSQPALRPEPQPPIPFKSLAEMLQANEQGLERGTLSLRQALGGSDFAFTLPGAGEGGLGAGLGARHVTVWGKAEYRGLSDGDAGPVQWDGDFFGAHVGTDARFPSGMLAGLALSMVEGTFDYTDTSGAEAIKGEYESRMTSAWPYLGWTSPRGSNVWATAGRGEGEVEIKDAEAGLQTSDSTHWSAAMGGSLRGVDSIRVSGLGSAMREDRLMLDFKGDAWVTQLKLADNFDGIQGLTVDTWRMRLATEGAYAFGLSSGASFTPSMELGFRWDGGDGETGGGMELGGGLDYTNPSAGLAMDVRSRVLFAHEGDAGEWSLGGSLRLAPKSGRGLSLQVLPSYGDTSSGTSRLWEQGTGGAALRKGKPMPRLDTEFGYGTWLFKGLVTPYSSVALSKGGTRGYRVGARFKFGSGFDLSLEGERQEGSVGNHPDHGVNLRGRMRW